MAVAAFTLLRRASLFTGVLVALAASPREQGKDADPRCEFLKELGQNSLALDGTFGDEGQRLSSALDALSAALSHSDALIQRRERAMAADLAGANPPLATRMHLALGGLYLDRLRVDDALKQLAAARASDPSRAEVPHFQRQTHAQHTGHKSAATESLNGGTCLPPAAFERSITCFRVDKAFLPTPR